MLMTVREFLKEEKNDVDVYGSIVDREGIAHCPTIYLTDEGEETWKDVLNMYIEVEHRFNTAEIKCDTEEEEDTAFDFFYSVAGYCSSKSWDKWFYFEEEGAE